MAKMEHEALLLAQHEATLEWARDKVRRVENPHNKETFRHLHITSEQLLHSGFENCRQMALDALEEKAGLAEEGMPDAKA